MIFDGQDSILGRLSSVVAKKLIEQENQEITVVNVEKIVRKGLLSRIIADYHDKKKPDRPRNVVYMFRQTVRSMLPKNKLGLRLIRSLRIYVGCPDRFKKANKTRIFIHEGRKITLEEIISNLK